MTFDIGDLVAESVSVSDLVVESVLVGSKITLDMSLPDGVYRLDNIRDFQTCPQKD